MTFRKTIARGMPVPFNTHTSRPVRKYLSALQEEWSQRRESKWNLTPNWSEWFEDPRLTTFHSSASTLDTFPSLPHPEVLFAGRSEVGKSGLIGGVIHTKNRTFMRHNSTPNSPPTFNFYICGKDTLDDKSKITIVDTPGYIQRGTPKWSELFGAYIKNRTNLKHIFLLYRGEDHLSKFDIFMLQELESICKDNPNGVRFQPIFSKCDQVGHRVVLSRMLANVDQIYQAAPSAMEPWIMTTIKGKGVKMGIDAMREAIVVGAGVSKRVPPKYPPSPATIFRQIPSNSHRPNVPEYVPPYPSRDAYLRGQLSPSLRDPRPVPPHLKTDNVYPQSD